MVCEIIWKVGYYLYKNFLTDDKFEGAKDEEKEPEVKKDEVWIKIWHFFTAAQINKSHLNNQHSFIKLISDIDFVILWRHAK